VTLQLCLLKILSGDDFDCGIMAEGTTLPGIEPVLRKIHRREERLRVHLRVWVAVCTENLNSDIMVMKSAKNRA